MLFVLRVVVGDEEETPACETDDAGPLAAGKRIKGGLRFFPRLAAVRAAAQRHAAFDVGVLAAEAEQVSVLRDDNGGVASRGTATGVVPGLAFALRCPDHADRSVAVVIFTGRIGGDVDGAVLRANDAVDGLRDVAADRLRKIGERDLRPRDTVVGRGGVTEWACTDQSRKAPEHPDLARVRFVVPYDGGCERGVGDVREALGCAPVFGSGAASHDEDGLVGIVLVDGGVVVGSEDVAVRQLLNRRVVIVDAESWCEAKLPTYAGHALALEAGEDFVHVIPGLRGIWGADRRAAEKALLLDRGRKKELLSGARFCIDRRRLYHAEADIAIL